MFYSHRYHISCLAHRRVRIFYCYPTPGPAQHLNVIWHIAEGDDVHSRHSQVVGKEFQASGLVYPRCRDFQQSRVNRIRNVSASAINMFSQQLIHLVRGHRRIAQ